MTDAKTVDGQGAYLSGVCPDPLCEGGAVAYRVTCEGCGDHGCDECIVDDGCGYYCDPCHASGASMVKKAAPCSS